MSENESIMSVVDNIADKIPTHTEDTYTGNDGLLYCSKCSGKRQSRVIFLGKERIMPCACQCVIERIENEKRQNEAVERGRLVQILRQEAFPNPNMQNWTFANDDGTNTAISNVAKKYAENFGEFRKRGKGLLLFGNVGTGKSFIAACIANSVIDKAIPVLMSSFPRIANTVQGMTSDRQAYYDSFQRYPLLVLDDLAAERKTEYMQEIVYNVINARCESGLPMIVTTNLTAEDIKNPTDETNKRIFSRLLDCCHPIEVKGSDRRKRHCIDDFESTKKLLGL